MQASKYNDRVVLFGDKSNSDMCREWQDVSNFISLLWEEFKKYYRHMSTNGSKYEMLCFKRFFIYIDFMEKSGITECVCLDSDILVFVDFSKIRSLSKYTAAFSVAKETGLAWGGCGYWKKSAMYDFALYCIDVYKNHPDKLNRVWANYQKKHISGGISDMTLLFWWYAEEKRNVWIWTKYNRIGIVDDNFSTSGNYLENEYFLDRLGIGKKIIIRNGKVYFVSVKHGLVRALTIHFQGKYKKYMSYYRKYLKIAFLLRYISDVKI